MDDKCKLCKNREGMCKDSVAMRNLCKRNCFDAFSPVTNADKYFRNATDEELAEWMLKFAEQIAKQATDNYVMKDSFAKDALEWLKQEVGE